MLPGLFLVDPLLCPPSTPEVTFWSACLQGEGNFVGQIKHFSFFQHKINKKRPLAVGPPIFYPESSFFALKPHAKFQNPRTTPFGRKVTQTKRERVREKENKLYGAKSSGFALVFFTVELGLAGWLLGLRPDCGLTARPMGHQPKNFQSD